MRISTFLQAAAFCCGLVFITCSCSTEASVQNEFLNTRNIPGQFFKVDGGFDSIKPVFHTSLISKEKKTFEIDTASINAVALFHNRCANCHHVFKDMTGPGLRGFNSRGPWGNPKNILAWLRNPGAFMQTNQYTKDLKEKFGSMRPAFPDLSLEFVIALTKYVNEVTPEQFEKNQALYGFKAPRKK